MSDEIRTPKDDELFNPQGGGGGTGAGPMAPPPQAGDPAKSVTLPQVGPEAPAPGVAPEGGAPAGAERPEASSLRLLMTLGGAGALAGALLVFVFLWSQPKILAYQAMVLREAVTEVLKGPHHFESIFLLDGELVTQVPEGVDTLDLDRVFLGYDEAGEAIGFAMEAEGFGFQDIIGLIFGYDAETRQVIGMKVLRHLETPGLGDKIVKDSAWVAEFDGVDAPVIGVKPDRNTGDPSQADMITGVTISSKAVIKIINERIAEIGDLLAAYEATGGIPAESLEGEGSQENEAGIPTPPAGTGGGQEEHR